MSDSTRPAADERVSTLDRGGSVLRVGHSPDPDDAFMFYGLAHGKVRIRDYRIEHVLEDIESLNRRAAGRELEVTAISAHAYPRVADAYHILSTGASMGRGYGPVVVATRPMALSDLRGKRVAIPGPWTTAALLTALYADGYTPVEVVFDQIPAAVLSGDVDAGVLIHEGQLTYAAMGLTKIADFGELWAAETGGLPLPLGLDVVRADLGPELCREINRGLRESILYARAHLDDAIAYALTFGRGLDKELGKKFVGMYVSEDTVDMGEAGREALRLLFRRGAEKGILPGVPELVVVD
ncbi:MAG: menaquinone biosynthesis family protein [Candidatus Eiseniibacteriota bacterium]